MGNAGSAVRAAQAQASVKDKFNKMTETKGPTDEEIKAKERMREERDRRNAADYANKTTNHAAKKKRLSAAWVEHKKANAASK